jgi:hypothetical protein
MSGFTKNKYWPRATAKTKLPPFWITTPFDQPSMQSFATFSEPSLEALSVKMISTCEKMVCRRNDSRQRGIHWAAFLFKMMTLTTGAGVLTFIEKSAAQNVPDPVFIFNPFPRRHRASTF